MRIGLLTHHWVQNFGANLQALSTFTFLTKMGNDVVVLNYRRKSLEDKYLQRIPAKQTETHNQFCDTYLKQSPLLRSERELTEFCGDTKFDAIIVGSDAVLRLNKKKETDEGKFPNPFWLMWVHSNLSSKPRTGCLAVSAMGTNYYSFPAKMRRDISNALRQIDYISVRDRWTRWMLFGVTLGQYWPRICPDPISVLNEVFELPDSYTLKPASFHKKYILLSVVPGRFSNDWVHKFVTIAHDHNLQVFSLPLPEGEVRLPVDRIIPLPLSPLAWYAWIQHAAGFVGSRFHPVVCSVFNDVPFVSIDTNSKRYFRSKGYLHFIKIRMASKQYDLCTNIQARSCCIYAPRAHKLCPHKVFEILQDWNSARVRTHVRRYVVKAKRDFAETIDSLLGFNKSEHTVFARYFCSE